VNLIAGDISRKGHSERVAYRVRVDNMSNYTSLSLSLTRFRRLVGAEQQNCSLFVLYVLYTFVLLDVVMVSVNHREELAKM
jgi:hypothetical protein